MAVAIPLAVTGLAAGVASAPSDSVAQVRAGGTDAQGALPATTGTGAPGDGTGSWVWD
ncbi:hypothetical protein AB0467_04590 [Streptomyces sp. NPDC052095]|uniref:hypothetical protein n=1 Tax=unclassified Streptomyces TaxID=2593676 RepID=UPI003450BFE0